MSESQSRTPNLSARDINLKLKYSTSLDASNNVRTYYMHLLALDII